MILVINHPVRSSNSLDSALNYVNTKIQEGLYGNFLKQDKVTHKKVVNVYIAYKINSVI